jgi:hypothetical protein
VKKLVIAISFALLPAVSAATPSTYVSNCAYIDAEGTLRYSGRCIIDFASIASPRPWAGYIIRFPNGSSVDVSVAPDALDPEAGLEGTATVSVNGIPAEMAAAPITEIPAGDAPRRKKVVITSENEVFIFESCGTTRACPD